MKSSKFRTLDQRDGIEYIFNCEEFKRHYDCVGRTMRGMKTKLKEKMATLGFDRSTIEGWIKGYHAPGDLETVRGLENIFNLPPDSFLTPRTKATKKTGMEEKTMREIKDYERDVARKLYAEICDMINGLEYIPEELLRATAGLIGGTPQNFKYLGKEPFPFMYRDKFIQNVRKVGFDLPKRTRDQLMEFIFEAFGGDECSDTRLYFESQDYKDYLGKNRVENNDDTKALYSVLYVKRLYEKLDAIFADYLCD